MSQETTNNSDLTRLLSEAINSGDTQRVKECLAAGADPNGMTENDQPQLIEAVRAYDRGERLNIVRILLENGASINETDEDGRTALYYAVVNQDPELVELLIAHGAEVENEDEPYDAPLYVALNRGGFEIQEPMARIIQSLVKAGANIKADYGSSPLLALVAKRCEKTPELWESILNELEDVDEVDDQGQTLLMKLVDENIDSTRIKTFIEICSLQINEADDDGNTALHFAVKKHSEEIVNLLLSNGADPNLTDNQSRTPLMLAVENDRLNLNVIQTLIESGADPHLLDDQGYNLVHRACINKQPELLKLLVDNGADLTSEAGNGHIPIQMVLEEKWGQRGISEDICVKLIEILIENGVDVNTQNCYNGETALHICAEKNYLVIAKALLRLGANPNIASDHNNETPLFLAIYHENADMAKLLINHGADVNQRCANLDNPDESPLQLATTRGMKTIVALLLKNGATE